MPSRSTIVPDPPNTASSFLQALSLISASHILSGMGPLSRAWLIFSQQLSVADSFAARRETSLCPPLSMLALLCDLRLCRSCAYCHNYCELVRAACPAVSSKHCFLIVMHCLWFWKSFHPLCNDSWALGRGVEYRCSTQSWAFHRLLFSVPGVFLYINPHLK